MKNPRTRHLKIAIIIILLFAFQPIMPVQAKELALFPGVSFASGNGLSVTPSLGFTWPLPFLGRKHHRPRKTHRGGPGTVQAINLTPGYKETTVLTMQPLSPVPVGNVPVLTVHLTTASGDPLANQNIRIFSYKNRRAQGITDSTGVASIPLKWNFYPGDYYILAIFNGSNAQDVNGPAMANASAHLKIIPAQVTVQTIPPMAGIQFMYNDQIFSSDAKGLVYLSIDHMDIYHIEVLPVAQPTNSNSRVEFAGWNNGDLNTYHQFRFPFHRPLTAGFYTAYPVNLEYLDPTGQPTDPSRISSIRIRAGTAGTTYNFNDPKTVWLPANQIVDRVDGDASVPATYYLENVMIDGSNVVNQGQQRFQVEPDSTWRVQLFQYSTRFLAHDALFHFPIGSGILLDYPNGTQKAFSFASSNAVVTVGSLPRGIYHASVTGAGGIEPRIPMDLSRDQDFELLVLSRLDLAILFGIPVLVALILLMVGRIRPLIRSAIRRTLRPDP